MIVEKTDSVTKQAVGCILTFNSKYLLIHRLKDGLWNSITGHVEKGESSIESIIRVIKDKLGIEITPSFFTTTYHRYYDEVVAYNLFNHNFDENPLPDLKPNNSEIIEVKLFSIDEALELDLYEDEEYCLYLHDKKLD